MGEPSTSSGGGGAAGGSSEEQRLEDLDPEVVAGMTADELKKFIDTGRTGRRNALSDVSQPDTSTAGMAEAMESMSVQSGNFSSFLTPLSSFFFLLPTSFETTSSSKPYHSLGDTI